MDYLCLSRSEYKQFIIKTIEELGEFEDIETDLEIVINRAKDYWDINIIGINYLFTIIIEQLMKKNKLHPELIERVYKIRETMFFTIEELDYKIIDNLFKNNLPVNRNHYSNLIEEAKRTNDLEKISELEQRRAMAFEEDLINVVGSYYESEIYH